MTRIDARGAAWRSLNDMERGTLLDDALAKGLRTLDDPRERAFYSELVRGALRWRGRYDHLIDHFASRPRKIRPDDRNLLRLGLHQLLACDGVPDYAAVDQTVRLARRRGGPGRAGFVNGLLQALRRRLGETAEARLATLPELFVEDPADPLARLAAWNSHPRWLLERWTRDHGHEAAAAICEANNTPPPLWLHVLPGADPAATAAALADAGVPCASVPDSRALRPDERLNRSRLTEVLAQHPELVVQDLSVQQATAFLVAGAEGRAVRRWWPSPDGGDGFFAARLRKEAGR